MDKTFKERLEAIKAARNMGNSDLVFLLQTPYPTIRSWVVNGVVPNKTSGIWAKIEAIEENLK
jgi:hypothetical protein